MSSTPETKPKTVSEKAKDIDGKIEKLKSTAFKEGESTGSNFFKTYKYVIIAAVGMFLVVAMGLYYAAPGFVKSRDQEGNEKVSWGIVLGAAIVAAGATAGGTYYFLFKRGN